MRYRLNNALSHIACAGSASVMSFFGIGFITVLLATLLLNHAFIFRQSEFKSHAPTLIAFLKDTVDESKGRAFVSQIEKNGQVLAVTYTSKAESLAHGETQFRDLGILIREAFAGTRGVNPFPASLRIYVDEDLITRKTLEQVVLGIKAHDEIEDVLLTGQGQLKDRLRDSERTTLIAIGVAVVIIWFIIGSVINKTAIARAGEIALMKLLGMPRRYLFTSVYCSWTFPWRSWCIVWTWLLLRNVLYIQIAIGCCRFPAYLSIYFSCCRWNANWIPRRFCRTLEISVILHVSRRSPKVNSTHTLKRGACASS